MNSIYDTRKPKGQHLETPPPLSPFLKAFYIMTSVLFGKFYVFFKINGMPIIIEKGVSINISNSVGINIYSLGSETNIFSFLTELGARSMPMKINLHENFFSVYKKHVTDTFFWES